MAALRTITQETQRAARIIRTLLHFSRKETEGHHTVNVRELVGKIVELREYQLRLDNIRSATRRRKPRSAVEANPTRSSRSCSTSSTTPNRRLDPRQTEGPA